MGMAIGGRSSKTAVSQSINYYTSSGNWTKTDRVFGILVCCIGPGGGAGGGITGTPAQNLRGGAGGGGGAVVYRWIPSYLLSSSVAITVPTGGRGGSGSQTTSGTSGANAADTTFGSWVIADGGSGGSGGSTGAIGGAQGGQVVNCIPNFYPFAVAGVRAANSFDSVPSTGFRPGGQQKPVASSVSYTRTGCPGGAHGGTKLASVAPYTPNIRGGAVYSYLSGSSLTLAMTEITFPGGATGSNSPTSGSSAENGGDGTSNAFLTWLFQNDVTASFGPGTGGGRGGFGSGSNGGNGGNGGNYGAGAGGGGSCLTPWTGGNGGNGGDGLCVVIEYYGKEI